MTTRETPRRILAESATLSLRAVEDVDGKKFQPHIFDVTVSYDEDRRVTEVAFTTRGKTGGGLDVMLQDMGLQLSRVIQGRCPATGEPLDGEAGRGRSALWGREDPVAGCGAAVRGVTRLYRRVSESMKPRED